jgi:Asp-tRNA(Asn)/Glu-tRNA(Gln) amidotransferase A subunit family amidase
MCPSAFRRRAGACFLALALGATAGLAQRPAFQVHEATISDLQRAIGNRRVTTLGVVEQYLRRIKAYNGTCVNEPQGILGPVTTIPRAGQITVPPGFTTPVWDRERAGNETRLLPIPAKLPVGVDFIARPFGEPMLFRIAAAYEAATKNRRPPEDFGPLP